VVALAKNTKAQKLRRPFLAFVALTASPGIAEFVSFDRQRALKALKRIVADLDDLAQNVEGADCAEDNLDSQTRHR